MVPNKFPALQIEGDLNRQGDGMYDKMNGIGAHEVVIETPEHGDTLASMSEQRIEDILWAFHDRVLDLRKDQRFKYILLFKNAGRAAGASLEHPHSQLIATPIIPKRVREELDGAKEYYNYKERCVFCDIVRQELNQGVRVISENDDFVAIAPYASRFPFEAWILPKAHDPFFEDAQKHEYVHLSKLLRDLLLRMEKVLLNPPYNLIIHSTPLARDGRALLPLAHRVDAEAHPRRGLRVGERVLYQSHPAGRRGQVPSRREGVTGPVARLARMTVPGASGGVPWNRSRTASQSCRVGILASTRSVSPSTWRRSWRWFPGCPPTRYGHAPPSCGWWTRRQVRSIRFSVSSRRRRPISLSQRNRWRR